MMTWQTLGKWQGFNKQVQQEVMYSQQTWIALGSGQWHQGLPKTFPQIVCIKFKKDSGTLDWNEKQHVMSEF
jgi:hypothetical protein